MSQERWPYTSKDKQGRSEGYVNLKGNAAQLQLMKKFGVPLC
jgi:hypothetical protein